MKYLHLLTTLIFSRNSSMCQYTYVYGPNGYKLAIKSPHQVIGVQASVDE